MVRTHRRSQRGFTLVELMVVIAIIATLAAMTVPAVNRVRITADRAKTGSKLRQIGLALINRESATHSYPLGYSTITGKSFYMEIRSEIEANTFCSPTGQDARPYESFMCATRHTASSVQPGNAPADFGYALDSGNYKTILGGAAPVSASRIADGASNTLLLTLIGVAPANYGIGVGPWPTTNYGRQVGGDPVLKMDSENPNGEGFGSPYSGAMPALYAEGHIGMLDYSLTTSQDFLRMWGYSDGEHLDQAQ